MAIAARTFGAVLVIFGLAYGALSVYALLNVDTTASTLEAMRAHEHKGFGFSSVGEWKDGVEFNAWLFLIVGTLAAVCGAGISVRKEWARRCWVLASAILVIYVLGVGFSRGAWQPHIELLVFAAPSFALLLKRFDRPDGAI
jgi:hypothetical protein